MERVFPIGRLAVASNTKVPTIRYYEQIGLLPRAERSEGNQRRYGERHLARLNFIRHARDLGFSVEQIRQLLKLADDPNQPCAEADAIARAHLAAIRIKIAKLKSLEAELKRIANACSGGTVAHCHVIEVLADHDMCLNEHH